ncbi:hypothetical protein RvY_16913-2 [Ramazzottius varieornatus]|uniref:Uncharacterized protein n=1 Tax=Ramazzottius varieornatus TaxID=947166 RepID=A0A1D1W0T9_RAMVA|nr:hypothetical protein RvY_16913-2 [Ramazzottius varieornatus]
MDSPSPLNLRDDHGGYLKKGGSSSGAVFQERLQQGFKWLKIKGNRNETLEEIDQSAEKDPWFPSMTRKQRFLGFLGFFAAGLFCFVVVSPAQFSRTFFVSRYSFFRHPFISLSSYSRAGNFRYYSLLDLSSS